MQVLEGRQVVLQYARSRLHKRSTKTTPSNTLFIGGIPYECSDRDLQDMFKDVQNVVDVRIPVDRRSGQIRGFAHAEFLDVQSAEKAKGILDNHRPYGKTLSVHFAVHKRVGVMVGESDRNRAVEEHRERRRKEREERDLERMESQMEDRFHGIP
jgi:RNA recognition motif-containing protein